MKIKKISVSKILKFSLWCTSIIPADICDVIHAPIPIILARCSQWQGTQRTKTTIKETSLRQVKLPTRVSLKIYMLDEWKQKPFACGCLYYSTKKASRKKKIFPLPWQDTQPVFAPWTRSFTAFPHFYTNTAVWSRQKFHPLRLMRFAVWLYQLCTGKSRCHS